MIDFNKINACAIASLPAILGRILPGGEYIRSRREYTVRNPRRADGRAGSALIRLHRVRPTHGDRFQPPVASKESKDS
jgi:hypothetical protein